MVGPVETIMLASHWVMASTSTFLCTWTPESWQGWHWKTGVRVGWNWTIQHHWHLWAGLRRTSTWYPYLGPTASGCFSRFERLLYQEEWRTRFEIEKLIFGLSCRKICLASRCFWTLYDWHLFSFCYVLPLRALTRQRPSGGAGPYPIESVRKL